MIFDSIENAELYYGLGEKFLSAFQYLKNSDFEKLPLEKVEIQGDEIFTLPQKYLTQSETEKNWESHRKYIDIQYVIKGTENIGFVLEDYLDELSPYDEENDIEMFSGEGDYVQVNEGEFVIFFPDDAHKPGLMVDGSEEVYKLVIKIKV